MELYKSNISFTKFKIILLNWKCNEDYFDMLYVKIEAMGTEISPILGVVAVVSWRSWENLHPDEASR